MKKVIGLFLGLVLLVPSVGFAQTDMASSTKAQLLSSLYALLQVLENEISAIILQQAQMASTTQQIISTQQAQSQQIQQIAQNTTPVFGGTGTPQPTEPVVPSCVPNPQIMDFSTSTDPYNSDSLDMSFDFIDGCLIATSTPESWRVVDQTGNPGQGISSVSSFSSMEYSDSKGISTSGTIGHFRSYDSGTTPFFLLVTVGGESASQFLDSLQI